MAKLELTRVSEYANKVRDIKVFIDNQQVGVISNGQTKEFEIPAGKQHTLQVKIDWCTSNVIDFEIDEHETRRFTMTSFAKHNPIGTFAAIYYITVASDKYLRLEETVL